jgi:hypothetical protein
MSFFAGLNDEKYDRQYTDRDLARRIVGYFKPQAGRLALVSLLVVIVAGVGAALPLLVSNTLRLLSGQPSPRSASWACSCY